MVSLEMLLHAAARSHDWEHAVIHRCAWCKRVDDNAQEAPAEAPRVTTDGMCAECAAEALAQIAARRAARLAAAA